MPKVSVVIPTCNRPDILPRAVRSVLAQTFQDFEIIVVDDGMKVRAKDVVDSFADSRIRYFANERSLGGGGTRNRGITEAKGEYVAFLDDDDEWLPTKLEKQVHGLDTSKEDVAAAFVGVSVYDDATGKKRHDTLAHINGVADIFDRTLFRCFIWSSALMVKRDILKQESFDPTFTKNQEWDLQLRIARTHRFYGIDEPLTRINTLHDDAHMGGKGNTANIANGFEQIMAKYHDDLAKAPRALARHAFTLAGLYRDMGRYDLMRKYFALAWRTRPLTLTYLKHYLFTLLGTKVYMVLYRVFGTH